MRGKIETWIALLGALAVASCAPHGRQANAPATAAPGKFIIEARTVAPLGFTAGRPTSCALIFSVFNNTTHALTSADAQIGPYALHVPPLPAHAQFYSDLTATAAPAGQSCVPTAQAVLDAAQAGPQATPLINCVLNGEPADACAAAAQLLVDPNSFTTAEIAADEQTAMAGYAAQQAQLFNQAKAQALATRGPLQLALGAALTQANPAQALSIIGVTKAGYDPRIPGAGPTPPADALSFCKQFPLAPAAQPPPGRLTILDIQRDPFGLAGGYRVQLACHGETDKTAWVKADSVERMMTAGLLVKAAALAPASPPATAAQPAQGAPASSAPAESSASE